MPNMHTSNIIPQYDASRATTSAPVSRSFQPTSTQMDMSMPLYSSNGLATTVPYQPGAFAYDTTSVNPYTMQQPSYYSSSIPHPVSYPPSADVQQLPTVRDSRNLFNPLVKSESTSPLQSNPIYGDASYPADGKRSNSVPTEGTAVHFSTDVDTLMKAIQAKQTNPPEPTEPKVCTTILRKYVLSNSEPEPGGHFQADSETSKALPVHCIELQQEFLSENSSRDPYSCPHWSQAICKVIDSFTRPHKSDIGYRTARRQAVDSHSRN
jgi:hypothetical protein